MVERWRCPATLRAGWRRGRTPTGPGPNPSPAWPDGSNSSSTRPPPATPAPSTSPRPQVDAVDVDVLGELERQRQLVGALACGRRCRWPSRTGWSAASRRRPRRRGSRRRPGTLELHEAVELGRVVVEGEDRAVGVDDGDDGVERRSRWRTASTSTVSTWPAAASSTTVEVEVAGAVALDRAVRAVADGAGGPHGRRVGRRARSGWRAGWRRRPRRRARSAAAGSDVGERAGDAGVLAAGAPCRDGAMRSASSSSSLRPARSGRSRSATAATPGR